MENRDEIAARLPEPRDDEPSSLRDDIVDELADHLQCAAGREAAARHVQGDETGKDAVASAVLDRFGDPSVVARSLWFEGMKEKLMTQRLTIATLLFVFAVTMGMCLVTWRNMASLPIRNAQLEQANAELLQELRALTAATDVAPGSSGAPAEWSHLQVKCVLDTPDGPPVKQVRVQLTSDSESSSRMPPFDEQTDEQGLIDFGQVLFGSYRMDMTAPCGVTLSRQLSVHPGRSKQETIVCPSQGTAPVHLNLVKKGLSEVPDRLREKLWWKLTLYAQSTDGWTNCTGSCVIYITPQGQYAVVPWTIGQPAVEMTIRQPQENPFWEANDITAFSYANHLDLTGTVNLPLGRYIIACSSICMQSSSDESGQTLVEMFSEASSAQVDSPTVGMAYINAGPNQSEPVTIEVTANPDRIRRIHLAANMPENKEFVSIGAEVPDGLESGTSVDVSIRFAADDGGLAPPLKVLSSVTVASVTPRQSSQPDVPRTMLMLSEEEAGIVDLARTTGRLIVSRHQTHDSAEPSIADSPFRTLLMRAQELEVPDDMELVAVAVPDETGGDEMGEPETAEVLAAGTYVRLTANVPALQTYNSIVTAPQGEIYWHANEFEPLLMQAVAATPREFQPGYCVYLLQARKQDQATQLRLRMHEARVEQISAEPDSFR